MNTRASDRMYDCLPLYHASGGVLATGALLLNGGSVVIRDRFSAREFWDDVVRWECTLFQYIGELCRYLSTRRRIRRSARTSCGWPAATACVPTSGREFKQRFRIPQILEFYAATEGNVSIFNFDGKEGAIGRVPWYLAHRLPDQGGPVRRRARAAGAHRRRPLHRMRSRRARRVIGKILRDASKPAARFDGYAAKEETDKKILRDVFEKGDVWFRTGDLMRKDARRLFLFRRPHRRHLPLEGRERLHHRGRRSDGHLRGRAGRQCLRRQRAGPRRPRRHGGDRRRRQRQPDGAARPYRPAAPRLCAAGVPAHPPGHGHDRDLQAEEGRPGEAGLRSGHHRRADLLQRSRRQGVRADRRSALQADLFRRDTSL